MAQKKPDEIQNSEQLPAWATGATGTTGTAEQQAPTWSQQVANLYGQITNRQPFSYDVNTDPLFKSYKDQYVQGGRRAMEDTMGQATGLTGGYGSSYSQAVGQQQYNDYMTRLNAEIPNLYAQARSAYDKAGDDLRDRLNMAMTMENQEYARGRDALEDQRYQDQLDYERGQAAQDRAYNMVMQMLSTGQTPSADLLAQAGVSADYAKAMANYYKSQMAGYGSGSGGSSGGGGRSSGRGRSTSGSYTDTGIDPNAIPQVNKPRTYNDARQLLYSYAQAGNLNGAYSLMEYVNNTGALNDAQMDQLVALYESLFERNKTNGLGGSTGNTRNRPERLDAVQ